MGQQHFLRERRQELGLSQFDLSLRLKSRGVSLNQATIAKWERGMKLPQLDKTELEALADALRWDLEQLMIALGETN
jgi:transcriptional regulator with XRE-family HTH domain